MKNIFISSLVYFGIVFAAGFILGTIRLLFLVPVMGERYAELAEMPLMLVAIYYSALYVVKRLSVFEKMSAYIYIGFIALLILLVFEFTMVLSLRGLSVEQYFASRDPISGIAYVVSLLIYMMMPYVIAKNS